MAETGKDIKKAKLLLEEGKLVAIPTETVYGLAANALDTEAVTKIFAAKNRPRFDPLIIHISSFREATLYAEDMPEKARALAEAFWPGPLTLLLQKKSLIPDLVTAGLPTVGIRCPDHPVTSALLKDLAFPLAAPSANPFGYASPTTPQHVNDQLGDKIDYILDGGPCRVGIESTIVGFDNGMAIVYRSGGLKIEEIESITGKVRLEINASSNPRSPGQLQSHYAPAKKIIVGNIERLMPGYNANQTGILSFQRDFQAPFQFILSPSGDLEAAARQFFSALRSFDTLPVDIILAEYVPDTGLGRAINDRLRRAAANPQTVDNDSAIDKI